MFKISKKIWTTNWSVLIILCISEYKYDWMGWFINQVKKNWYIMWHDYTMNHICWICMKVNAVWRSSAAKTWNAWMYIRIRICWLLECARDEGGHHVISWWALGVSPTVIKTLKITLGQSMSSVWNNVYFVLM